MVRGQRRQADGDGHRQRQQALAGPLPLGRSDECAGEDGVRRRPAERVARRLRRRGDEIRRGGDLQRRLRIGGLRFCRCRHRSLCDRRGRRRRRGRHGRRASRLLGQRPELGGVELAALHLADDARRRAVLDKPRRVDDALAQRPQERDEVLLAAVAEQRRARVEIDVPAVADHLQPLVLLQAVDGSAIHPPGVRLAGQEILAAQVSLHRDDGAMLERRERSRRDRPPREDHRRLVLGRLLARGQSRVRDLLGLFGWDDVLLRQLLEHAVLDAGVARVTAALGDAATQEVQAARNPEHLEVAILASARVLAAGAKLSVREIDEKGTQRLRLVRRLGEDARQPLVGEIEDGQTVVSRRLGRLLPRGASALDHGKVARVGRRRRRGRRWLGVRRERRGRRTGDQSQEQERQRGHTGARCVPHPSTSTAA